MLYLKTSYGDVIKITDTQTGERIAAFTVRGIDKTEEGIDIFNIAIDSDRKYKITKTMLKDQFSHEG